MVRTPLMRLLRRRARDHHASPSRLAAGARRSLAAGGRMARPRRSPAAAGRDDRRRRRAKPKTRRSSVAPPVGDGQRLRPTTPPSGLPDTIGIRASMPGSRDGREVMYMRFRVQFFSTPTRSGTTSSQGGDSGWLRVGLGALQGAPVGPLLPHLAAVGEPSLLLRGKVNFEWRLKGEVVRSARRS